MSYPYNTRLEHGTLIRPPAEAAPGPGGRLANVVPVPSSAVSAALALGSNLGNSPAILQSAWQHLQRHPAMEALQLSSFYMTEPLGMNSANNFVNAAALIRTTLNPWELLAALQEIEALHGRHRPPEEQTAQTPQDRLLDLDLLLYGTWTHHSAKLTVPHPRLLERLFMLVPLAEISGSQYHPLAQASIASLCQAAGERIHEQKLYKMSPKQCRNFSRCPAAGEKTKLSG